MLWYTSGSDSWIDASSQPLVFWSFMSVFGLLGILLLKNSIGGRNIPNKNSNYRFWLAEDSKFRGRLRRFNHSRIK